MRLEVVTSEQGPPKPSAGLLRIPFSVTANGFRLFEELLTCAPSGGVRIREVIAPPRALVVLSLFLVEKGVRPRRLGVRRLALREPCAPHWRRWLALQWRARVSAPRPAVPSSVLADPWVVESFLEGRPEVARDPHPALVLGLVKSPEAGRPRFRLARSRRGPKVQVELRFDARLFPERAEQVAEHLAAHLLARHPALRALERRGLGELEVELVRPGTLARVRR